VATIRKRDGRWRAQIRKRGYPHQFRSFPTKAEALGWTRQIESEMDRSVFVSRSEADHTTVCELLDRYLKTVTPSKASADREALRIALLKRRLGCYYLSQLTSSQIASYRDSRLQEGRGRDRGERTETLCRMRSIPGDGNGTSSCRKIP
jgi:hypothetical protein